MKEIEQIIYDVLNGRIEGIKDFIFHKLIEYRKNELIRAKVSYTWFLNGHAKPVENADVILVLMDGKWRRL